MERSWEAVLAEHTAVVAGMRDCRAVLDRAAALLIETLRSRGRIFVCGNGGSAADAQHIAAEFTGRFKRERPGLAAIALTTDTSALTAIGNDYGFETVFSRQVEALVAPRDVLWALSTSGNSPNVLAAVKAARELGAKVLGFSGGRGGALAALCDVLLLVPHENSDRIQEGHALAYHYLCERVELAFV